MKLYRLAIHTTTRTAITGLTAGAASHIQAAAALTCTVALTFAVRSSASTRSDLNSAAHQLSTLTEQIKVEEARATGLQGRLSQLNAQMDAASRREDAIASDLVSTQQQIADITGQTSVNVNRVLADMERQGLIRRKGREIQFTDWAEMRRVASFQPNYLEV